MGNPYFVSKQKWTNSGPGNVGHFGAQCRICHFGAEIWLKIFWNFLNKCSVTFKYYQIWPKNVQKCVRKKRNIRRHREVSKMCQKCQKMCWKLGNLRYQKSVKNDQIVSQSVPRVYKAHFFDTRFSKRAGCRHFFYTLQGRTENQAHYFDTPFLHAEKTGHFVRHCSPTLFAKK